MKQEFIVIRTKETAVKIQNSQINAVRLKDIVKKGVRVYENGKIGIAGAIGDIAEGTLLENAVQNLTAGIGYPYPHTTKNTEHRCYNDKPMTAEDLLALSESVLDTLRQEYSDFSFSETIAAAEIVQQMRNTEGLDLEYKDALFSIGLILKDKKSANLFDGFIVCEGRQFDPVQFWNITRPMLEAYRTPVALPVGETLPILAFDNSGTLGFLSNSLNGERYATGSSLFSAKMGKQLFNEKINLELNRNPKFGPAAFFDMEGVVLKDDCHPLIEAGKLVNVYTDKNTAHLYNLPHTGAAAGEYDDMPGLAAPRNAPIPLRFKTDSTDLKAALKGQPAILVVVSSGGDFTPDGSFAAPVQVSFLFDGERIVGKLPEFTMRSHLYKMLGEDYIGTFDNNAFYLGDLPTQLQSCYMTIMR
ncbi:MAG TPA: hypothetical protein DDY38_09845 [Firmicutes bacterium]|nr:hypothetical protein [Bacillota bacterium]